MVLCRFPAFLWWNRNENPEIGLDDDQLVLHAGDARGILGRDASDRSLPCVEHRAAQRDDAILHLDGN